MLKKSNAVSKFGMPHLMVALALLSSPIEQASAAVVVSSGTDPNVWSAHMTGMPDLDQTRATCSDTIPGLPYYGQIHCGPASAANVLSYFAQNGHPFLISGSPSFEPKTAPRGSTFEEIVAVAQENRDNYNRATELIETLGEEMGTMSGLADSDGNGTSLENVQNVLASRLGPAFSLSAEGTKGCSSSTSLLISPKRIYNHLRNGAILILNWGYYVPSSKGFVRDGGHFVTITGIESESAGIQNLFYNSPSGHDGGWCDQSRFTTEESPLALISLTLAAGCTRNFYALADKSTSSRIVALDRIIVIKN